MLVAYFPHSFLLAGIPSCGCGVAGVGFAAFGVDGIALVVAPIVKGVCAVVGFFQKTALHQGSGELLRIALPSGFQGNVDFVHALQYAGRMRHGRGNPEVDKAVGGTGAEQEAQPLALPVAPE